MPVLPIIAAMFAAAAATATGVLLERWLRKRDERGDEPVRLEPQSKSRGELPEPEPEPPPEAP
jgi:hypothetical protein